MSQYSCSTQSHSQLRPVLGFNPLGPESDQHQFSSNNTSTNNEGRVMRINQMVSKGKML